MFASISPRPPLRSRFLPVIAAALGAALLVAAPPAARADHDDHWGHGHGHGHWHGHYYRSHGAVFVAPGFYGPPVVGFYAPPPPVYYAPPPPVYVPVPQYYAPAPAYGYGYGNPHVSVQLGLGWIFP
jgi:hypothetical protein